MHCRLVPLGFVLAGCGVGVDETVLAEAEGVQLVDAHRHGRELACAGGHGFGFCWPKEVDGHTVSLVFDDRSLRVPCRPTAHDARLRWDDARDRLALYCDASWRVVYLGADRYVGLLDAPSDFDGEDWTDIEDLAGAAVDLWGPRGSVSLLAALTEAEGREATAEFLTERCLEPSEVHWPSIFEQLDPASVPPVRDRLRTRILAGEVPAHGECIGRASGVDAPPLTDAEQARVQALLANPDAPGWLQRWLLWELRRTPSGPKAACTWVGAQPAGSWTSSDGHATTVALLSILDGEDPCPALASFVDPPCHAYLVNTDRAGVPEPFSQEEHEMVLATIRETMIPYRVGAGPVVYTVVREALQERSTDAPAIARMDRLGYTVGELDPGCDAKAALVAACEQPTDAVEAEVAGCRFPIDDETRRIGVTP